MSLWLQSGNQNDGVMGAWAKGKDASDQKGPSLPGPFQEQENLWNENGVSDLERTHLQVLTLREAWTLGKPNPAPGNLHPDCRECRTSSHLSGDVKASRILE